MRPLPGGRDELGDTGRALAAARDRLRQQDDVIRAAQAAREEQTRANFLHQRQAEMQFRKRTQSVINSLGQSLRGVASTAALVVIRVVRQWTPVLSGTLAAGASLAGAVVGLLAGLYPALRATRMQSVDALRGPT